MAVIIRKYQPSDREACQYICIATAAPERVKTEKQRKALSCIYSDSYVDFTENICFVAEDDAKGVVGYILCAPDTKAYCRNALKHHILPLLKTAPADALGAMAEFAVFCLLSVKRPAHMHIDILESHQRMGLGTQLVNTLLAALKEQKCKGLFLITDTGNKKGSQFYNKYGFTLSHKILFALVYTIDF
ncbi:MAG: GNAT family N-acetyltransferase [Clostridia bacterium]|nr:GNAT family N-acetyltransferase [Clostridia bacterium]